MASAAWSADFVCKVRDIGNGFIPATFVVQFEEGAAVAMVYDDIIFQVHGAPIEAALSDRGNGRIRLTYRVNNIPANPRDADIGYRVDLDTQRGTLAMRGFLPGVTNSIAGKGTCEAGRLRARQ